MLDSRTSAVPNQKNAMYVHNYYECCTLKANHDPDAKQQRGTHTHAPKKGRQKNTSRDNTHTHTQKGKPKKKLTRLVRSCRASFATSATGPLVSPLARAAHSASHDSVHVLHGFLRGHDVPKAIACENDELVLPALQVDRLDVHLGWRGWG